MTTIETKAELRATALRELDHNDLVELLIAKTDAQWPDRSVEVACAALIKCADPNRSMRAEALGVTTRELAKRELDGILATLAYSYRGVFDDQVKARKPGRR